MRFVVTNKHKTTCIGVYSRLEVAEFIFAKSRLSNGKDRPTYRAEHIIPSDGWCTPEQEEITQRVQSYIDSLDPDGATNAKMDMYHDSLPTYDEVVRGVA